MAQEPPVLSIAHRGASGYAPENTLAAIQKAIDLGANWIEIDVHLSKDKEVVVIHDKTFDRTTSGSGFIAEFTTAEFKEFSIEGSFTDVYPNEKVPTLGEILALIDGQVVLLIEMKRGNKDDNEGLVDAVVAIVNEYDARDWCILQSFSTEMLISLHQLDPDLEKHQLIYLKTEYKAMKRKMKEAGITRKDWVKAINPSFKHVNEKFVERIHKEGYKVFVYTVNSKEDIQTCMFMGVDGIISNYPDRVINMRKRQD